MENPEGVKLDQGVSLKPSLINPRNKDLIIEKLKLLATSRLQCVQMDDIIEIFSEPAINSYMITLIQAISILIHRSHTGPDWSQLQKQSKNGIQFLQDLWRINKMPEDLPEDLISEIEKILPNNPNNKEALIRSSRASGLYYWLKLYLKIMKIRLNFSKIEKISLQRNKARRIFLYLFMKTRKRNLKLI